MKQNHALRRRTNALTAAAHIRPGTTSAPNALRNMNGWRNSLLRHQCCSNVRTPYRYPNTTEQPPQMQRTNIRHSEQPWYERLYDVNASRTILVRLHEIIANTPCMDTIRTDRHDCRQTPTVGHIREQKKLYCSSNHSALSTLRWHHSYTDQTNCKERQSPHCSSMLTTPVTTVPSQPCSNISKETWPIAMSRYGSRTCSWFANWTFLHERDFEFVRLEFVKNESCSSRLVFGNICSSCSRTVRELFTNKVTNFCNTQNKCFFII